MRLPIHLNALRAFEASARHQSFSAAAAELNVTPAAVGQLVRGLEEGLGTPLFVRHSSGRVRLVATDAALRALPDIRAGFDRLSAGLDLLRQGAAGGALTITVSPAFAAKWLLPRFERFQAACPETDVRLDTHRGLVDYAAQGVDIGVRYGSGHWPGLKAEKLMDEEVFPVCAPGLLQRMPPLHEPADLARVTLIHNPFDGLAGFPNWDTWLRSQGVVGVDTSRGLQINDSASVLQAAAQGRGVALARSVLVRDDLEAGRVQRLFPQIRFPSPLAYYIVYRPESANLPRAMAFRDWLLREAVAL